MEVLPEELWRNIFSFYDTDNLIELYLFNDQNINKILDDNMFWFWYFKARGLPIFNNGKSFIEWVFEYNHTRFSIIKAKSEINYNHFRFHMILIWPISILTDLKIDKLNKLILTSYFKVPEKTIDIVKNKNENGLTMYITDNTRDENTNILISKDYNIILNIVIKLLYYQNVSEFIC